MGFSNLENVEEKCMWKREHIILSWMCRWPLLAAILLTRSFGSSDESFGQADRVPESKWHNNSFGKKLTFLTASKRSCKKNSSKQWPAAHLRQNYMFPFPHTFSSTFPKIAKSHLKMNWKVEAELFKNSLKKVLH
ncbi:hypothetical protein CEXT_742201 [Caerostris extrusa]|uniref:Uncharacterized protein n=1 Tax=Caerostris extrusa TaxID=172846 RepID=A0AAV4WWD5_CAEEX|nr:hypothetical protein CEXT_742201 [Caerostris extrusa]